MNPRLQRGLLLLEQGRHNQAEHELRQALVAEPNDSVTHAALGICLAKREQFAEAGQQTSRAIELAPDQPFGFYAHALVLRDRNRLDEAEKAIEQAIDLDPHDADYQALLGQLYLRQSKWEKALHAAQAGLAVEPDNVDCTNVEARALTQLNRPRDARAVMTEALARDPENAWTHANLGWTLLGDRKYEQAMDHFREALRLEPDMEWARLGVIEALKAKRILYRPILAYFLWISQFRARAQWGIILGAFVGARVLNSVAAANPALAPWVWPIIIAYSVWALSTWMAAPLFNVVLLLDPLGRLALSRNEKIASALVGGCVLGALVCVAGALAGLSNACIPAAIVCGLLIPPISQIFNYDSGWPRVSMIVTIVLLACMGALAVALLVLGDGANTRSDRILLGLGNLLLVGFIIGSVMSQLAANLLAGFRRKR